MSQDRFKIMETSGVRTLGRTWDCYFLRNRNLSVRLMASVTSALLVLYCFLSLDLNEKNKAFLARMEKKKHTKKPKPKPNKQTNKPKKTRQQQQKKPQTTTTNKKQTPNKTLPV